MASRFPFKFSRSHCVAETQEASPALFRDRDHAPGSQDASELECFRLHDVWQGRNLLQHISRYLLVDLDKGDGIAAGIGAAELERRNVEPRIAENRPETAQSGRACPRC